MNTNKNNAIMNVKKSILFFVSIISILISCTQAKSDLEKLCYKLEFEKPKHGFISSKPASNWEESLISGNGTVGILIPGDVNTDRIVLSHERIFLPRTPSLKGPDLEDILDDSRNALLQENFDFAVDLFKEESRKAGFTQGFVWTNPHIPAC